MDALPAEGAGRQRGDARRVDAAGDGHDEPRAAGALSARPSRSALREPLGPRSSSVDARARRARIRSLRSSLAARRDARASSSGLRSLPDALLGSAVDEAIVRGTLWAGSRSRQKRRSSRLVRLPLPGAAPRTPRRPRPDGVGARRPRPPPRRRGARAAPARSRAALTRWPPIFRISLARPARKKKPSASRRARSPVQSQPSPQDARRSPRARRGSRASRSRPRATRCPDLALRAARARRRRRPAARRPGSRCRSSRSSPPRAPAGGSASRAVASVWPYMTKSRAGAKRLAHPADRVGRHGAARLRQVAEARHGDGARRPPAAGGSRT